MTNTLNDCAHASNNVDIRQFMIMPISAGSRQEALRRCAEVFHTLKVILKEHNIPVTGVCDEGGYAPMLKKDEDALSFIVAAIERARYMSGEDFMIAIDAAASEWCNEEQCIYRLPKAGKVLSKKQRVQFWKRLAEKHPIISMEDGMAETDWEGWRMLTKAFGSKIQIVGDDLFVINAQRLKQGIEMGIGNSILIEVNQIGTLTETLDAIAMTIRAGYTAIISTVPVRRRMRPLRICQLHAMPDRSKAVPPTAVTGLQNTINFSV